MSEYFVFKSNFNHKGKTNMRMLLCMLLSFVFMLSFSSCSWNSKKEHRTYKEALEFAQSLDPNAIVEEQYFDIEDEWGHEHREWNAVINGIECHVASSERWENAFAGEFISVYFVLDTDYDYYLLKKILEEKQPDWIVDEPTAFNRYQWNDIIGVETSYMEKRELNDEELELAWQHAYEVYLEYNSHPIRKEAHFYLAVPIVFTSGSTGEDYIRVSGYAISDFDEQAKKVFFDSYRETWKLMESGLPIET